MRTKWALPFAVLGMAAGLTGCGQKANKGPVVVPKNAVAVHVTASDFIWKLDKNSFQSGIPIDFKVQSTEGVHGFHLVGTNVSQTISSGQKPVDVVWTPPSPGSYTIKCDVYCGSGHENMFLTFQVH